MFIGTGSFSNRKVCGRKVPIRLRKCPHCREPDPHLKNILGWRVDYAKSLNATVPQKLPWPFRIPIGGPFTFPSLIVTVVVALVVDYLYPDLIIELLGLPYQSARGWVDAPYFVICFVLGVGALVALNREDREAGSAREGDVTREDAKNVKSASLEQERQPALPAVNSEDLQSRKNRPLARCGPYFVACQLLPYGSESS